MKVLKHSAYGSNPIQFNFYFFGPLKRHLGGNYYNSDEEVIKIQYFLSNKKEGISKKIRNNQYCLL